MLISEKVGWGKVKSRVSTGRLGPRLYPNSWDLFVGGSGLVITVPGSAGFLAHAGPRDQYRIGYLVRWILSGMDRSTGRLALLF